ncbi:hypothetical protein ACLQ2P_11630 [Actinomadura citrea]|uniref:hypothetical protein n=1 Tax=Actinomadura citrea TaxID=46158 RepID=UPI003CE5375A
MQLNGTPILERHAGDVETAPYALDYSETTAAVYDSDVPTGTRLADLSGTVAVVVARLGLAEVATRAKRLNRCDIASGTRNDRHAYDGYDVARLKWARLEAFATAGVLTTPAARPTAVVPVDFYSDVAALWGWSDRLSALMADPTCDHRRAAATIRAEVPTDEINAVRARGLALAAVDEMQMSDTSRSLGLWTRLRSALACGHPLLSVPADQLTTCAEVGR